MGGGHSSPPPPTYNHPIVINAASGKDVNISDVNNLIDQSHCTSNANINDSITVNVQNDDNVDVNNLNT